MSKRAEVAALQRYAMRLVTPENVRLHDEFQAGYEQAEKDTIERAIAWLKEHANNYIVNITESYPDAPFQAKIGWKCWEDLIKAMEDEQMTYTEAIEILRKHNEWRRYDGPINEGPEMTDPKLLGEAIDTVVAKKYLALTIADIERIHVFLYAIKNNKQGAFTFTRLKDEQYQEVLDRFNRTKEEEQ